MAKSDQGYTRATSSSSGGGGRPKYASKSKLTKAEVAQLYLRIRTEGILDMLGVEKYSDVAMQITDALGEQLEDGPKHSKDDLWDAAVEAQHGGGRQAFRNNAEDVRRHYEADMLIAALESSTRPREREQLDEGDYLDDMTSLMADGSGWGEEQLGSKSYKKHVNICIDNSGSTHMPSTGYCSAALATVAQNLMEVLYEAAGRWPGVTWDAFSFNRIAKQHTGSIGRANRAEMVRQALRHVVIPDPLDRDAVETNLGPLMEALHDNEVERGLIGQPRLDIIITDGEFESEDDAARAAEWQRQRGTGLNTYVINICPDTPSEVALPHQFRVVPLHCNIGSELRKEIDGEALRQTLMRIVVDEMQKLA